MSRTCPTCEKPISGHPNKKFCNAKCKDRHHNMQPHRVARSRIFEERRESDALLSMIARKERAGRIEVIGEERHELGCDCYSCLVSVEDDF